MPRRTILETERPPWARSIRARRLAARLSQGALAQRIGLSQATVADWETGRSQPRDAEKIRRLAEALGAAPPDISPHSFSWPGAALPVNPFQADELDQLFGSLFGALSDALQAAEPAVPPAVVARWARRIWRLAGGTEHEAPDAEMARRLMADQVRMLVTSCSTQPDSGPRAKRRD
jgi:transcriptional regulator with XRE-family HTH domain